MLYELETDERFELWDGEKQLMTPSGTDHEYILSNLNALLHSFVKANNIGKIYANNTALYLHGDVTCRDYRLGDLSIVHRDRLDIVQARGIYGPPDLVVEIVSPGKKNAERDLVEKYAIYERYGVQEYWIVTPYLEEIKLYSLQDGKYSLIPSSQVLQGIELNHEDIFE
ncbi:Uma2 family endonuclease [Paenibacillus sp. GCM10023252]|uniref:Uma2 family endonuclease n=1 Tax=Paenibacillus sp. GCM10023252 TaxID=3252649 RepID=UPI0036214318